MTKTRLFTTVGILIFSTAPAFANCPYNPPESAPIWQSFEQTVQSEYGGIPQSNRDRSLIYGHAMGRVEGAAGNNSSRALDLACIKSKLERDFLKEAMKGSLDGFDWYLAQEAAEGRHDDEVQRISGVWNSAPLYKAFEPAGSGGSYTAGPVAGGTSGGGGVRIQIREGSRPNPNNQVRNRSVQDLFGPEAPSEGPNYDDLPYTPNGPVGLNPNTAIPPTNNRTTQQPNDPKMQGDHPCGRPQPQGYYGDAYWYMDLEKYKADRPTTTYGWETEGLVCAYNQLLYYTYEGQSFKEYECDAYWINCRRSNFPEWKYTKILDGGEYVPENRGKYVQYYHKKGRISRSEYVAGTRKDSKVKKFWMIGR